MKKYLQFHLKGEDIFSYFLIIVLICVIPAIILSLPSNAYMMDEMTFWRGLLFGILGIAILAVVLILAIYILKMVIQNVEYDEERFKFSGEAGEYVSLVFKGILLSIITLGIYLPFFIRELMAFYIGKTSYKDEPFKFMGKGGDLFVIFLFALIVPLIVLALIFGFNYGAERSFSSFSAYGISILETAIISPFVFLYYRWFVDIRFKNFHAQIDTDMIEGIGVVLLQTVITAATFGIYFPVAYLKIYKYYLEKVKVKDDSDQEQQIRFGYDIDPTNDFLYIWGQTLLTIITLGIYSPWAYCNILDRVLGKTWMETK
ncbi:MAG: DUF6693 family protein [Bacteroidales bacterium]